jgi:hypothetical protein
MGDPAPVENLPASESGTLSIARSLIRFWNGMVSTLAVAFLFGQFWSLASAVYLLLRRDVDETEMDEIFLSERTRSFDLPPLQADDRGIPVIRPLDASPGPSDGE